MKSLYLILITLFTVSLSQAQAAPGWHSWAEVVPLPPIESIDFSAVRSVKYEVYDINATNPAACPGHCFRATVFVNGEFFANVPTSPGSALHDWGGRTPEFRNTRVVYSPGYKAHGGYRMHGRNYLSGKRRDNLRYFLVFYTNSGNDIGIGFHGDKGGAYPVTGRPESHGCMRLTDSNAKIFNYLARAVLDNTGSTKDIRLTAYDTRRKYF